MYRSLKAIYYEKIVDDNRDLNIKKNEEISAAEKAKEAVESSFS